MNTDPDFFFRIKTKYFLALAENTGKSNISRICIRNKLIYSSLLKNVKDFEERKLILQTYRKSGRRDRFELTKEGKQLHLSIIKLKELLR